MKQEDKIRLKKILAEILGLDVVPEEISQKNCSAWDSISQLNLIVAIETEFGVEFVPEEISSATSLEKLSEILSEKI